MPCTVATSMMTSSSQLSCLVVFMPAIAQVNWSLKARGRLIGARSSNVLLFIFHLAMLAIVFHTIKLTLSIGVPTSFSLPNAPRTLSISCTSLSLHETNSMVHAIPSFCWWCHLLRITWTFRIRHYGPRPLVLRSLENLHSRKSQCSRGSPTRYPSYSQLILPQLLASSLSPPPPLLSPQQPFIA